DRINGSYYIFKLRDDLFTFFFGKVLKVLGQLAGNLALPVRLWISKDLLALVLHSLQSSPHRIHAGSEAPLQHGHGEPERTATRGVIGSGFNRLIFHVSGEGVVKDPFL